MQIKKSILLILVGLVSAAPAWPDATEESAALRKVDLDFRLDTGEWETGRDYELSLILRNRAPFPIRIAGVQADFNYDPAVFPEAPTLLEDYITGYDFLIEGVDTLTPGVVYYIKGVKMVGRPNYFSLEGDSVRPLADFRFRVNEEAPPGESEFRFRVTVAVVQRRESGETVEIMGQARNGRIRVIAPLE